MELHAIQTKRIEMSWVLSVTVVGVVATQILNIVNIFRFKYYTKWHSHLYTKCMQCISFEMAANNSRIVLVVLSVWIDDDLTLDAYLALKIIYYSHLTCTQRSPRFDVRQSVEFEMDERWRIENELIKNMKNWTSSSDKNVDPFTTK